MHPKPGGLNLPHSRLYRRHWLPFINIHS